MDKIYKVDLIEQGFDASPLAETLESLLNERVEDGYILDKMQEVSGKEPGLLVITIKPPEPEMLMMTPDGRIPIIGS